MNDTQENKHTRNKTVDKALDDNASVIAGVPLFVSAASNLKGTIAQTDGYSMVQLQNITGYAEDKKEAEAEAIANVMILVGPMKAWARSNNDMTFFEMVNYSVSDLERLRDTTLGNTLTMLNNKANDNIAALAAVGLTGAEVANSQTTTASYIAFETAPRNAIGVKANATALIKVALKQADGYINQIRDLIELFKTSNPTFYNTMKSALVIVDTGSKKSGNGSGGGGNVVVDEMIDILPASYFNIDMPEGVTLKGTYKIEITINPSGNDTEFGCGPNETSITAPLTALRGEVTVKTLAEAGLNTTDSFVNLFNPGGTTGTVHVRILKK